MNLQNIDMKQCCFLNFEVSSKPLSCEVVGQPLNWVEIYKIVLYRTFSRNFMESWRRESTAKAAISSLGEQPT